MKNNLPLVSIIIPCRNEENFIERCLNSLIKQNYPKESLEILVVDGMSEDGTGEIVREHIKKYSFIKLLENPKKYTPFGLNIGIGQALGEVIIIAGAHAAYAKDYISKCLKYLEEYKADNVGGILRTVPKESTLTARAIAACLAHPFGAGGSYFRTGSEKPRWVDTVFSGCYKKEVFERIGLFNEKLIRSQDIEFNKRLRREGLKILLAPDIVAYYYPQTDLVSFFEHNFLDGIWTIYPLKFRIRIFSWRHLIPLLFVLAFFSTLLLSPFFWQSRLFFNIIFGSYLFLNLFFSLKISSKRGFQYLFLMPVVFAARHFGYGLGSIWGLIKVLKS